MCRYNQQMSLKSRRFKKHLRPFQIESSFKEQILIVHPSKNGVQPLLEFKQLTIALALTFKQQRKEVQTVTRIIIFTVILIFSSYCNGQRERVEKVKPHERVTNTHFFVNLAHSSVYVHFLLFLV